jgi:hypothetical protein
MFELWIETKFCCERRAVVRLIADGHVLGDALVGYELDAIRYHLVYLG